MRWQMVGAALLLIAGAGALFVGHPDAERKLAWARDDLDRMIQSRAYHIDPAELLELMWNNQLRLALLDVRDEADFNLFHLIDARNFTFSEDDMRWSENLPTETVRVVMSNDEALAEQAWKRLFVLGVPNIYILAGGINEWLSLCKPHEAETRQLRPVHFLKPGADALGEGVLKYSFPAALGDRYPEARPPDGCFSGRTYVKKVTVLKPVRVPEGGCGG